MTDNKRLLQHITEAIQERKGKQIKIVDMRQLESYVCEYFVICEGNSNTQIVAISESVHETLREQLHIKPYFIEGAGNALWVIMDYGDIMVHIFDKDTRRFYDLEHLWSDAVLTEIPDMD